MAFTKKGGDINGDVPSTVDAWNVAEGYAKLKILRLLIQLDRWDTIAQFGTEEIDEDTMYTQNQINKRRVEALQRFYSTIKQLLGNVGFATKKNDKKVIEDLLLRLKNTEEFIDRSYSIGQDAVTYEETFDIDEKRFRTVLNILEDIKEELNTPLNNSGLIFRQSDEVDLDKMMNEFIEGG